MLLKSLVAQLFAELQSRDGRISDLEHRMSLLLRKLYGSKSEKLDPRQASLFDLLAAAPKDQPRHERDGSVRPSNRLRDTAARSEPPRGRATRPNRPSTEGRHDHALGTDTETGLS